MANLYKTYQDEIHAALQSELGLSNPMEVPRIEKVTINMGVGDTTGDKKILDAAVVDMTAIAGQKPVVCMARKSEAGFKIREGSRSVAR